MRTSLAILIAASLCACSSTVDISVNLVDPCNQTAIDSMGYLTFRPKGEGLETDDFSTTVDLSAGSRSTPALKIPLVNEFSLSVSGYKTEDITRQPDGLGVSGRRDLTNSKGQIGMGVLFALTHEFYKTTKLASPDECSATQVDRFGHTATYIPENGRVLIVGGARIVDVGGGAFDIEYPRIVEMYDPATGSFDAVAELRVGGARQGHTATRLKDGRVLIAGGEARVMGVQSALKSAFIIDARDPGDVQISEGGLAMRKERTGHTATALDDGKVLLAGGRVLVPGAATPADHQYLKSLEIFDPEANIFTLPTDAQTNALEMSSPRYGHSATLLRTGKDVLLAGGMDSPGPVLSLEVVRLGVGAPSVAVATDSTGVGPIFHASGLAQNGAVLLSGGYSTVAEAEPAGGLPNNPSAGVEMWSFNESNGQITRTCTANLLKARGFHTLTMSARYAIFVGGRDSVGAPLGDAEVATLALGANCFTAMPDSRPMADPRAYHAAVRMENSGEIMVVGGRQQSAGDLFGRSLSSAEVFSPRRDP